MRSKKIFSILLLFCVIFPCSNIQTFAEEQYAMVSKNEVTNVTSWGVQQYAEKDGIPVIALNNTAEGNNLLYIDINDSFMYGKYGITAEVEIAYYASGTSKLSLGYSQLNTDTFLIEEKKIAPVEISVNGNGRWETKTFTLENAAFVNSCSVGGGSDFYFKLEELDSTEEFGVKYVKIKKKAVNVPVIFDIAGNTYGNIFGTRQGFTIQLSSLADESCVTELNFFVIDESGKTVYSSKQTKTLAARAKSTVRLSTTVSKYGIYKLKVDAVTNKGTYSETVPFSVINESNGNSLNNKLQAVTHLVRYGSEDEVLNTLKRAGFGGVRDEIHWATVEAKKGKYVIPDKDNTIQSKIINAGMESMLILCYGNPFYDNKTPFVSSIVPWTDEGIKAYADYCGYMASQYKDTMNYYEIWNEYNLKTFNAEERGADVYAKMLKAAHDAITRYDADAKIVAMVTVGVDAKFVDEVLAQGVSDYIDAISVHPYQYGGYSETKMLNQMTPLLEVIDKYNLDVPVWFSENGWSTANITAREKRPVTEYQQAVNWIKSYAYSQAMDFCERTYVYDIQDDGNDCDSLEQNFGIIHAASGVLVPGAAKPAYVALAGMNKLLANAEYSSKIDKENAHIYNFECPDGSNTAVLWGEEGDEVILKLGTKQIDILDMYTNVKETKMSYTNAYKITLKNEPIYIKGNFTEFSKGTDADLVKLNVYASFDKNEINEDEQLSFSLTIDNDEANETDVAVEIQVIDGNGKIAAQESDNVKISPHSMSVKPYKAPKVGAGSYTLRVNASYNDIITSFDMDYTVSAISRNNSIVCQDGKIIISGTSALPDSNVAVYITDGKNKYTNQLLSGEDGKYFTEIPIPYIGDFNIFVNNGELYFSGASTVGIKLLYNGGEIGDLKSLKDGDRVNMTVSSDEYENLNIYTAVYNKSGKLDSVYIGEDVDITIDETDKIGRIACFVWTEDMVPIAYKQYTF